MYDFVMTAWLDRKLWKLSNGVWSEITPAVPSSYETQTILKARDGSIWRHDGSGQNFLRLSGGSWDTIPAPNSKEPDDYTESEFDHIYTVCYYAGVVGRVVSGAWVGNTAISQGCNTVWCDGTGQHVYAATLGIVNPPYLFYSNNYGVSFSDITSEFREADTLYGGLWGFGYGSDHIVVLGTGYTLSPFGGKLIAGKAGGAWLTLASQTTVYRCNRCTWGPDLDNLVCLGMDNSTEGCVMLKRHGSSLDVVESFPGAKTDVREGREISGSGTEVVTHLRRQDAYLANTYRSTDGGENWVEVSMAGIPYLQMSGISVPLIQSEWVQTPPYLQNQDPAPDSTGNAADTSFYLEIIDDNGDLDTSTVDIYIDGTLAWSSDAPQQPGFSATKAPVTNGYGYRIYSWEYYDPGSHTVRVVAEDDFGNTLDESYVFSTVASEVSMCGRVQWGQYT